MSVADKVKELIIEIAEIERDKSEIDNDKCLLGGGYNLDSIIIIELISELEDTYNFVFEDEDISLENFNSINNIVKLLNNKGVK